MIMKHNKSNLWHKAEAMFRWKPIMKEFLSRRKRLKIYM